MATEDENVDLEDAASAKNKKAAKHEDTGAADLEKITDYVEEAEISSQRIGDAMRVVSDRQAKQVSEKRRKEHELSRVKINKDDVDLIVNQMEIAHQLAERKLREHQGDVVKALIELTN